jgi:hypothetical protein
MPGPSDYNPNDSLKKMPRATIGNEPKKSCLVPREKSPGPQCYEPKRLQWKRRASAVIFNREKRNGIIRSNNVVSPGPGSYMIPCKFYDKPKFMIKGENHFRFV